MYCWHRTRVAGPLRVVAVGDRGCGKTSLLRRLAHLPLLPPQDPPASPLSCDVMRTRLIRDGAQVELELVDTGDGVEALPVRIAAYAIADVILLCFCIDDAASLDHVTSNWLPEVREYCRKTPILLVGNKTDVRHAPGLQTCVTFIKQGPVKVADAQMVAQRSGAVTYVECSAKRDEGLTAVLQGALHTASARKPRRARLLRKLLHTWTS